MSYVVLARKWRPQTFADLVGQDHVSRTLANAIASDRVAHAFLFTGVRGVGKTTSARILAKALNCEKGPTATPCLTCNACREIADGTDIDVQEIDGASYTGIDAVRGLQETIPYRPARDRYKIFIVDEVHMLSMAAWNAFLKTLEEPPPHVKFIFATTEVNKVPVTILSRCQRYDFKLISSAAIAARLRHVLEVEKVAADDDAVRIVAREAAGSMRDAMSLLDQVIAWVGGTGERLTSEGVSRVLGVAARSVLGQLATAVVDGNPAAALDIIASLAEQGFSLTSVARDFLHYLRDLVVARVSERPEQLVDLADEELTDLVALAKRSGEEDLSRIYLGFSRAFDDIVRSSQPRGALEMALVRLSRRPPLLPLDELLRRLADLEQRLGGPPAGTPRTSGGRGSPPARGEGPPGGPSGRSDPRPPPQRAQPRAESPAPPPVRAESPSSPPVRAGSPAPPTVAPRGDWDAIIALLRAENPRAAALAEHAAPLAVSATKVTIAFPEGFLASQAEAVDAKAIVERAAQRHFGMATQVVLELGEQHPEVQTVAQRNTREQAARVEAARKRVEDHPLVHAAIDILGAELKDVKLPSELGS